jgi:rubrerythrin
MSINHANPSSDELYYECAPCGYTAPASIPIGLCPNCGESLHEKTILTR